MNLRKNNAPVLRRLVANPGCLAHSAFSTNGDTVLRSPRTGFAQYRGLPQHSQAEIGNPEQDFKKCQWRLTPRRPHVAAIPSHTATSAAAPPSTSGSQTLVTPSSSSSPTQAKIFGSAYKAVIGACNPGSVLAVQTKLGSLRVSVGIDTGYAVNVISLDCYKTLCRTARGSCYLLRPSDLSLTGVAADKLDIHGVAHLPLSFAKKHVAAISGFLCSRELCLALRWSYRSSVHARTRYCCLSGDTLH